jgi:radical SAM superfamily enzyme YgiQ (UPF0313 family)
MNREPIMSENQKVLLTTVFRPFGIVDEFNEKFSQVEFFHVRSTCRQGLLSIRGFHPFQGLHVIAANLRAKNVVLQYPSFEEFSKELKNNYDYVGIAFNTISFEKVKKMCAYIRENYPKTKIILGGFGTTTPGVEELGDYVIVGPGVTEMKKILGEPLEDQFKYPLIKYHQLLFDFKLPLSSAYMVATHLGCPYKCDFCPNPNFYKEGVNYLSADQLFHFIKEISKHDRHPNLAIYDDDLLADTDKIKRLHHLITTELPDLDLTILCFGDAGSITKYDPIMLLETGVVAIWTGVEFRFADYDKLSGVNLQEAFKNIREAGLYTVNSVVIGSDIHTTKENIFEDLDYLCTFEPTFSQIAIISPMPNTELYQTMKKENRLLNVPWKEYNFAKLVFQHPTIGKEEMERIREECFEREFETLGYFAVRMAKITLNRYNTFKNLGSPVAGTRAKSSLTLVQKLLALFPTAIALAPNKKVKEETIELQKEIIATLKKDGSTYKRELIIGKALLAFAFALKLKYKIFGHKLEQPKLSRTEYPNEKCIAIPADLSYPISSPL